ncbi:carbamate kinase [Lentilactobacillus hilgardii]|uniref:Carbamate kinase n=1 Tax=Lentilactobacillus hilgardii (strain ATCC 8290 / DSM 20176 / CCUG 30140 / JCM 1155 / KCTC 3500 / NBRC 15886 / NCIMB 8040 / NRRL B-1843 / 9) TaxID=1423757 RepID=C0XJB7_LENH9|nr:carbamate kinase [Lentilactobacillus hilgardii]MCI2019232.1 carbamate kinase [Lentilactobacillus buchneri]EEI24503.1 carbamate kinase [Lentilactobacillus hilgardii DSM 20176 = ATCC 8290]KRK55819.1 carbamate kinase [Lentilactobacillus hilgardii DSM 20176 = ATCC 8290]MCP9333558.1 carbamate kinase [Lentilactobacillus hilgardii]MCP9350132.1 carbamate kinase [Lentilactobacillus hilgardii]
MAKVVVALGGNAILSKDASAKAQMKAVKETAKELVNFIKNGDQLIITHGNGPQVGNLLLQQIASDSNENPAMPLDTCGAMTQGSIGYWFQNAMKEELLDSGINKDVISIVTQTIVDENDPAFQNPSKPIGPFYKADEVAELKAQHPDWEIVEDAGRGYRRVVASPKPLEINEYHAIKQVVDAGIIPIVSGGGGIPVVRKGNRLVGTEAVIDKDFSASKIAQLVDADKLIILTSVGGVFYNYGKPNQQELKEVGVDEVQAHIDADEFAKGSMMPKVKAAVDFVRNTGNPAVIGALEDVQNIIKGTEGTTIVKQRVNV